MTNLTSNQTCLLFVQPFKGLENTGRCPGCSWNHPFPPVQRWENFFPSPHHFILSQFLSPGFKFPHHCLLLHSAKFFPTLLFPLSHFQDNLYSSPLPASTSVKPHSSAPSYSVIHPPSPSFLHNNRIASCDTARVPAP